MTDHNENQAEKHRQQLIEQAVRDCLQEHYGIEGELQRLNGENLNFLVIQDNGQKHVLKVVDDDMPPEIVELEFAIIEHLRKANFSVDLPKISRNLYGQIETRINNPVNDFKRARIIDFLNGKIMENVSDISLKLLENVGKTLAEFDLTLENFDHPAAHRTHRWDLANAGQHRKKTSFFCDGQKRQVLDWAFRQWETEARPGFDTIPWQLIHADGHDGNLLVDGERVTGLVDFGDVCYNPTICELGVSLPYMMKLREDPFEAAQAVIKGYTGLKPLSPTERNMLFPLICARLAVTITVAEERRRIDPHNPGWFGSEEEAWRLLKDLYSKSASAMIDI